MEGRTDCTYWPSNEEEMDATSFVGKYPSIFSNPYERVYIVKSHNWCFPVWYLHARGHEETRLITFDYHTDTHCIDDRIQGCLSFDCELPRAVKESRGKISHSETALLVLANILKNDEQIVELSRHCQLSEAHIVHRQINDCTLWEESDLKNYGFKSRYYSFAETQPRVPDEVMRCAEKNKGRYILDFDLDFFTDDCSCLETDQFDKVIAGAMMITIATEEECYKELCKGNVLDNKEMLERLLNKIKEVRPGAAKNAG